MELNIVSQTTLKYECQGTSRVFDVLSENLIRPPKHTHDKSKLGPDVFTKHLI